MYSSEFEKKNDEAIWQLIEEKIHVRMKTWPQNGKYYKE